LMVRTPARVVGPLDAAASKGKYKEFFI
jgi:hypothetical protein